MTDQTIIDLLHALQSEVRALTAAINLLLDNHGMLLIEPKAKHCKDCKWWLGLGCTPWINANCDMDNHQAWEARNV